MALHHRLQRPVSQLCAEHEHVALLLHALGAGRRRLSADGAAAAAGQRPRSLRGGPGVRAGRRTGHSAGQTIGSAGTSAGAAGTTSRTAGAEGTTWAARQRPIWNKTGISYQSNQSTLHNGTCRSDQQLQAGGLDKRLPARVEPKAINVCLGSDVA